MESKNNFALETSNDEVKLLYTKRSVEVGLHIWGKNMDSNAEG